jgi:aminoglycoside phosphotransferase (APT) family kinase protein
VQIDAALVSAEPYAAGIAKEDRALPLLSAHVTVDVPEVVAAGEPSDAFPLPWSVRRWLDGEVLSDTAADLDRDRFAEDLATFLVQLRAAPAEDGPARGRHSFACDLVIAWTFMGAERERFRAWTGLDADTWARARGWALWKALVTLTEPGGPQYAVQERALANLLADAG